MGKITLQSFFDEDVDERSLLIQNQLGGQLVLEDLDDLLLESGECYAWSLNDDIEKTLRNSRSLRNAIRRNLVRQLTAEQYERELEIEEVRSQEAEEDYEERMTTMDITDNLALDVDRIDLTKEAARGPKGRKRSSKSQELKKDPLVYAKLQTQMRVQNPNLSPHEFARMIDEDPYALQRMLDQQNGVYNPKPNNRAVVANANGYGGVDGEDVPLGNFARDGKLAGARTHRQANVYDEDFDGDYVESLELSDDSEGGHGRINRI